MMRMQDVLYSSIYPPHTPTRASCLLGHLAPCLTFLQGEQVLVDGIGRASDIL